LVVAALLFGNAISAGLCAALCNARLLPHDGRDARRGASNGRIALLPAL